LVRQMNRVDAKLAAGGSPRRTERLNRARTGLNNAIDSAGVRHREIMKWQADVAASPAGLPAAKQVTWLGRLKRWSGKRGRKAGSSTGIVIGTAAAVLGASAAFGARPAYADPAGEWLPGHALDTLAVISSSIWLVAGVIAVAGLLRYLRRANAPPALARVAALALKALVRFAGRVARAIWVGLHDSGASPLRVDRGDRGPARAPPGRRRAIGLAVVLLLVGVLRGGAPIPPLDYLPPPDPKAQVAAVVEQQQLAGQFTEVGFVSRGAAGRGEILALPDARGDELVVGAAADSAMSLLEELRSLTYRLAQPDGDVDGHSPGPLPAALTVSVDTGSAALRAPGMVRIRGPPGTDEDPWNGQTGAPHRLGWAKHLGGSARRDTGGRAGQATTPESDAARGGVTPW
jgi:uncharacterized membrane protein